jgi:recombination protein RecA
MAKKKEMIHIEVSDYDTFEADFNKEFGKGVIRDADKLENPLPNFTGSLILNVDLAIPIPEGRIIEIFGGEGSGKTTVGLEILGQAQQRGKKVLYVNAEENLDRSLVDGIRTLDPNLVDQDGIKTFQIIQFHNGTAEQYFTAIERYLSSFRNTVCLVDSIDALVPEAVLSGDYGDSNMGNMGKCMSTAMRRLKGICAATKSTIVFINQIRKQLSPYGDPRVTPGGEAIKFYASQRIRFEAVNKASQIINDDTKKVIGHRVRYYIVKNKAAPPYIANEFPLIYGQGIYREYELAKLIKDLGLVETSGQKGCYIHIGEKKYTMDQLAGLFISDPDLYQKYLDKVNDIYFDTEKDNEI